MSQIKNILELHLIVFILFFLSMDKDSQDVHQELAKLKAKIQEAREQISNMPGIDSSPVEQQQQLATLREQVRTKNQLLQKYKSLCMFEVPKASWHWKLDYCTKRKELKDSRVEGRTLLFTCQPVELRFRNMEWTQTHSPELHRTERCFCVMRMQTCLCGIFLYLVLFSCYLLTM